MIIYPAIDLRKGRVVRLLRGEKSREIVYADDPVAVAGTFARQGARWIHVVDLDRAFGEGSNLDQIKRIAHELPDVHVQTGGGIRSLEDIALLLDAGLKRVVLGTAALNHPEIIKQALQQYGDQAVALALDTRKGKIATHGWLQTSTADVLSFARRYAEMGVKYMIYTDIGRDGMLTGPDTEGLKALLHGMPTAQIIASGGVHTLEDIVALKALKAVNLNGVIIGRALYEKEIDLTEALKLQNEVE